MKKYIITFMLLFVALVTISAKGNNKRIILTTTPQMHCNSCEQKIMGNIRFVKGVKIIQTSIPQQTVTITYDSTKCSYADLEKAFKKINYTIKEVDPKTLPSCCAGEAKAEKHECEKADKKESCENGKSCDKKSEGCCKKESCSKDKACDKKEGCCKNEKGCDKKEGCKKESCDKCEKSKK